MVIFALKANLLIWSESRSILALKQALKLPTTNLTSFNMHRVQLRGPFVPEPCLHCPFSGSNILKSCKPFAIAHTRGCVTLQRVQTFPTHRTYTHTHTHTHNTSTGDFLTAPSVVELQHTWPLHGPAGDRRQFEDEKDWWICREIYRISIRDFVADSQRGPDTSRQGWVGPYLLGSSSSLGMGRFTFTFDNSRWKTQLIWKNKY